jgi:hypothetical protein
MGSSERPGSEPVSNPYPVAELWRSPCLIKNFHFFPNFARKIPEKVVKGRNNQTKTNFSDTNI